LLGIEQQQACHVDPSCSVTIFDAAGAPACAAPCSECTGASETETCVEACDLTEVATELFFRDAVQLAVGDASGVGLKAATIAAILNQTDIE